MAEVTKRHREIAFAAIWSDCPRPNEQRWIDTGEEGYCGRRLERTAQALADIEAEQVAERGHLEEAASLLVKAMKPHEHDLGPRCAKWLEAERTRQARRKAINPNVR